MNCILNSTLLLKDHNHNSPNLFMIHDGYGKIEAYIELARQINIEFNIWGIIISGNNSVLPFEISIEEIAEKHIKIIKDIQREGPYYFIGWCAGGVIAFEIARILIETNNQVNFVTVIDAIPPGLLIENKEFNLKSEIDFVKAYLPRHIESINLHIIKDLWDSVVNNISESEFHFLLKHFWKDSQLKLPFTNKYVVEILSCINISRSLEAAQLKYIPKNKVKIPVYHFLAIDNRTLNMKFWDKYCCENPIYLEVKGNHNSIIKNPNLKCIVNKLEVLLTLNVN